MLNHYVLLVQLVGILAKTPLSMALAPVLVWKPSSGILITANALRLFITMVRSVPLALMSQPTKQMTGLVPVSMKTLSGTRQVRNASARWDLPYKKMSAQGAQLKGMGLRLKIS
jgi:hypothetical protein